MSDNSMRRCIDADCPARETCARFIPRDEIRRGTVFALNSPRFQIQDRCDEYIHKEGQWDRN